MLLRLTGVLAAIVCALRFRARGPGAWPLYRPPAPQRPEPPPRAHCGYEGWGADSDPLLQAPSPSPLTCAKLCAAVPECAAWDRRAGSCRLFSGQPAISPASGAWAGGAVRFAKRPMYAPSCAPLEEPPEAEDAPPPAPCRTDHPAFCRRLVRQEAEFCAAKTRRAVDGQARDSYRRLVRLYRLCCEPLPRCA